MMLEVSPPTESLTKKSYRAYVAAHQARLFRLQRACWQARIATVTVFEGWDTSGKGAVINKVTRRLEPRGCEVHDIRRPRTHELQMPWLWRFWHCLPRYGAMALLDSSWYRQVFEERVEGGASRRAWNASIADIVSFERTLASDRYLVVKLFLHIEESVKNARLIALEADPLAGWRVSDRVRASHRYYGEYRRVIAATLEQTHTAAAPWTVISGTDLRWSRVQALQHLNDALERGLERHGIALPAAETDTAEGDE